MAYIIRRCSFRWFMLQFLLRNTFKILSSWLPFCVKDMKTVKELLCIGLGLRMKCGFLQITKRFSNGIKTYFMRLRYARTILPFFTNIVGLW